MSLPKVRAYITDIKEQDEDVLLENYGSFFEEKRLARIESCKNGTERKRLILTGTLLYKVLSKNGADPKNIAYEKNGKPYLKDADAFFFNISHSGDLILICTSDIAVGADIQKITEYRERLACRVMSTTEKASFEEDFLKKHFNFIWAVKESCSKLTGDGLGLDLSRVTFKESKDVILTYIDDEEKAYTKKVFSDDVYEAVVTAKEPFEFEGLLKVNLNRED